MILADTYRWSSPQSLAMASKVRFSALLNQEATERWAQQAKGMLLCAVAKVKCNNRERFARVTVRIMDNAGPLLSHKKHTE